jgi:hypothetical protein
MEEAVKRLNLVLVAVFTAVSLMASQAVALTADCTRFAGSGGVGTSDGLYWALRCISSSVVDYLDQIWMNVMW